LPAEGLVHLFIHALRLDRHVVEVGAPEQRALALAALLQPYAAVLERAGGLPFLGDLYEQLQRGTGIRYDPVVRHEHAANLSGFDIDMHELAAFGVHVDRPRMPVGPAIADAENEVGRQKRSIAIAVAGL